MSRSYTLFEFRGVLDLNNTIWTETNSKLTSQRFRQCINRLERPTNT